jgi:MFS family permease
MKRILLILLILALLMGGYYFVVWVMVMPEDDQMKYSRALWAITAYALALLIGAIVLGGIVEFFKKEK